MNSRGFTLLETLVAISILSLALAGILSLFSMSLHSSSGTVNQIKAFFLAGEVIEYVRNKRDSNILAGKNWSSGLNSCQAGCYVDVYDFGSGMNPCSGVCPKLKFNSALNRYDYEAASAETTFTRKLTIEQIDVREIKLLSEISWMHGSESRRFTLEEHIFDLSLR